MGGPGARQRGCPRSTASRVTRRILGDRITQELRNPREESVSDDEEEPRKGELAGSALTKIIS